MIFYINEIFMVIKQSPSLEFNNKTTINDDKTGPSPGCLKKLISIMVYGGNLSQDLHKK